MFHSLLSQTGRRDARAWRLFAAAWLGLIANPVELSEEEFQQIVDFVRYGLTDPDAAPEALMHLVPLSVPSGLAVHDFELGVRLGGEC